MPKTRRPRLSWFRFYADDFLGGTGALTAPECGRYLLLLLYQWGTKERQLLPSDPERLRVICRGEDPGTLVLSKFVSVDGGLRNERLADEWEAAKMEYDHKAGGGGVRKPTHIPVQIPPQIPPQIGPPTKNQEPRTKQQTNGGPSRVASIASRVVETDNGNGSAAAVVAEERRTESLEVEACRQSCAELTALTGKPLDEILFEFSEFNGRRLVRMETAPPKWLRVTHDRIRAAIIEARRAKDGTASPRGEDPLARIRRGEAELEERLRRERKA